MWEVSPTQTPNLSAERAPVSPAPTPTTTTCTRTLNPHGRLLLVAVVVLACRWVLPVRVHVCRCRGCRGVGVGGQAVRLGPKAKAATARGTHRCRTRAWLAGWLVGLCVRVCLIRGMGSHESAAWNNRTEGGRCVLVLSLIRETDRSAIHRSSRAALDRLPQPQESKAVGRPNRSAKQSIASLRVGWGLSWMHVKKNRVSGDRERRTTEKGRERASAPTPYHTTHGFGHDTTQVHAAGCCPYRSIDRSIG